MFFIVYIIFFFFTSTIWIWLDWTWKYSRTFTFMFFFSLFSKSQSLHFIFFFSEKILSIEMPFSINYKLQTKCFSIPIISVAKQMFVISYTYTEKKKNRRTENKIFINFIGKLSHFKWIRVNWFIRFDMTENMVTSYIVKQIYYV